MCESEVWLLIEEEERRILRMIKGLMMQILAFVEVINQLILTKCVFIWEYVGE